MSIGHPVTDAITGRITGLAPGVECDNQAGFLSILLHDSDIKWARFENLTKQCTRMRFNETLLHDSAKTQTRAIAKNTMLIPGTEYHFIVEVEFRYQQMWNLIACLLVYFKSLSKDIHQTPTQTIFTYWGRNSKKKNRNPTYSSFLERTIWVISESAES